MTLITTTILLLHLAFAAAPAPAGETVAADEPTPRAVHLSGQETADEADAAVPQGRFRLAPGSAVSADPRLYRRDI